ncbi:hypothetical protein J421_2993 [Gemmatirosa kalamazoonensis]|uniref:SbsA Ig-like domain-containing protein n=1 Tax=Gemmatirosa kalamazoonensis TaxID=861299 RepID=W0RJL2_9BACT|nr:Ig-like domain-containing protein [Gemmatirosa kalamazoonensis]AHG90530.1 hypothetical protein J421_2993 [Gemmatirosa kalamazoonensis]
MTGAGRGGRGVVRRLAAVASVAALALAASRCASPGIPPGGPPDDSPPQLLRISPESGATNVHPREFELEFDEVVAEVPTGANAASGAPAAGGGSFTGNPTGPNLASIMVLSPRAGALRADWHRDRVTVHARQPLRANTTYTLTVLPGLADLRSNVRDSAIVVVFSTGPTLDTGRVGGIVFDWVAGRVAQRALVEAIGPDSVTYVAVTDTGGRFVMRNLPVGTYAFRGVLDVNNNRAFDPREAYDLVSVGPPQFARGDSAKVELLAFVHDTLGPRLTTVAVTDSVTLRLTFDKPLDPAAPVTPDRFRVVGRDSTVVPVIAAYRAVDFDSLKARIARARAPTRSPAPGPRATRRVERPPLRGSTRRARAATASPRRAATRRAAARPHRRRCRAVRRRPPTS